MRSTIRAASGLVLGLCAAQAFAINLTPNAIGGGNIPGTYSIVDFYTGDGDWAPVLKLPAAAPSAATITIHAQASYDSNVLLDNTDLPLPSVTLKRGDTMKFTFDANARRWTATIPEYTTTRTFFPVPASTARLVRASIRANDTVQSIVLPATAVPGAILLVQSSSRSESRVESANLLHASTLRLGAGERYAFVFHPELRKWYLLESAVAAIGPQHLVNRDEMRPVTRARTELTLPASASQLAIKLPATAGDRDRIRVKGNAAGYNAIRNDNIDYAGTLLIHGNDSYDFMWVAEKNRWVMMSSPTNVYTVNMLYKGELPNMTRPTARLRVVNGNWAQTIRIPPRGKPGDRVIIESAASGGFNVVRGIASATFTSEPVANNETVVFVVDAQGRWTRETRTIDMLNIYADKVASAYGTTAARARQLESFRLTNEALENSRANFRLRMVGLMQHRDQGATLGDALNRLRTDRVVQGERERLRADAIYYEGAEEGCGLAWVNSTPNAFNMIASGSIACGTTLMRHEFGHNMGLSHGDDTNASPPYAKGYSLQQTIMAGNSIPYYATPAQYDAQFGLPLGIPNQIDAVRAMNEHSEAVSNFYR